MNIKRNMFFCVMFIVISCCQSYAKIGSIKSIYEFGPPIDEMIRNSDIVAIIQIMDVDFGDINDDVIEAFKRNGTLTINEEIKAKVLHTFKGEMDREILIQHDFVVHDMLDLKHTMENIKKDDISLVFLITNERVILSYKKSHSILLPNDLFQFIDINMTKTIEDLFISMLNVNESYYKLIAIPFLSQLLGKDSVPAISEYANSNDPIVLSMALISLVNIGQYEYIQNMLDYCNTNHIDNKAKPSCNYMIKYLDAYEYYDSVPYLISMYYKSNKQLKRNIIKMLGYWGDSRGLPVLASCLDDPDVEQSDKFYFCAKGMERIIGPDEYQGSKSQATALGEDEVVRMNEQEVVNFWRTWWEKKNSDNN